MRMLIGYLWKTSQLRHHINLNWILQVHDTCTYSHAKKTTRVVVNVTARYYIKIGKKILVWLTVTLCCEEKYSTVPVKLKS